MRGHKRRRGINHLRAVGAAITCTVVGITSASRAQSIILNSGMQGWLDSTRTSRADMLILGDSVVWTGGNGWDAGLIRGFSNRVGLAGTGLGVDGGFTGEGEGYAPYGDWY